MILPARQSRLLTLFCALLQLALPGALGVLDAIIARNARHTVVHIEETTGQQCRPPHPDECIICQYLSTGAIKTDPAPVPLPQIAATEPRPFPQVLPRSVAHSGFRSRAPPETVI